MTYEYGIDFDAVEAIDIHTHVEVDCHGHNAYDDELVDATRSYFKMGDTAAATVDELAAHYRDADPLFAEIGPPRATGSSLSLRRLVSDPGCCLGALPMLARPAARCPCDDRQRSP